MGLFPFRSNVGLITAAFLIALATAAHAQNGGDSASLRGSVRDSTGRLVAGAKVYLQAPGASAPAMTVTDSQGEYRFTGLAMGPYTLRASAPECGEATYGPLNFLTLKETKQIDLTLQRPDVSSGNAGTPEFYDKPAFTVAGVTDATNLGGHGSNTVARTNVALAKDVASLGKGPGGVASEVPGGAVAEESLRQAEEHTRALIARGDIHEQEKAELHHSLGDIKEKLGDPLEGVREYQRAAELDPSEPHLFDWGAELLLHHAPEPAIEVFTKGNRLYPQSARMLAGLGVSWYARGSHELAAQRLGEASDLNPDDPGPYLFLGKLQSLDNTHSDLYADRLARFARLHPENAQANYYYAVSLWKGRQGPEDVGRLNRVEFLLQTAVKLDPRLGAAYLQLGVLYSEQKSFPKAINVFHKAIAASPELEQAHYRLALVYRQMGDKPAAEKEFQLYEQLSKQKAEEDERARHEIQQFVYSLQGKAVGTQP